MDTTATCAQPWIDNTVSRYLSTAPTLLPPANFTGYQTQFQLCCVDPQNCVVSRPGSELVSYCTLGVLLCSVGSTSYVCRFHPARGGMPGPVVPLPPPPPHSTMIPTGTVVIPTIVPMTTIGIPTPVDSGVCYQEGKLAQPRTTTGNSLSCCKAELPSFLRNGTSPACLDSFGTIGKHSKICCPHTVNENHGGGGGGGCEFRTFACSADQHEYNCQGGDKTAICTGILAAADSNSTSSSDTCVMEIGLGSPASTGSNSCLSVKDAVVREGDSTTGLCLFKVGGDGATPTSTDAPAPPQNTSRGAATGPKKKLWMAMVVMAPLLQLVFQ